MNKFVSFFKKYLTRFRGMFPTPLPGGMDEFEALTARLIAYWNLPTHNERDVKFALTTTIMHLGPLDDKKSDYYFVKTIRAGAAKQIAGAQFHAIKTAHNAEVKALAEQEATAMHLVASEQQK